MEKLDFQVTEEDGYHKITAFKNSIKVSWLSIPEIFMHYGDSIIRTGGIAGVFTPREHRGKGYSSTTLRYSIQWMKKNGYSLSALFGIQEYYHRFGFAGFMGEHILTSTIRNASRIKISKNFQWKYSTDPSFRSRDIALLYEENYGKKIAYRVRNPVEWKGFKKGVSWQHPPTVLVLTNDKDDLIGYAALERWPLPDEMVVAEINAKNHCIETYNALVRIIYEKALEEKKGIIKFYLPLDHPLIDALIPYGIRIESTYLWSGGGMARVINMKKLFEEITDEIETRSISIEGDITIDTIEEKLTLFIHKGSIKISQEEESTNKIKLTPGELAQMVLGYRNPQEIILGTETHGNVGILEKIFPKKTPYIWQPDMW